MIAILPSVLLFLFVAGCVIPPPFEEKADGNPNYPPVIRISTPPMPGLNAITIAPTENTIFSIDVDDKDVGDTLYLRVFRNYPTDSAIRTPLQVPNDPDLGTATRTIELPTGSWCGMQTVSTAFAFDVMVADRPFVDDPEQEPINRVVQAGGEWSIRSWIIVCAAN